jgi:AbrB family looped-hinge helix DNA binding protein
MNKQCQPVLYGVATIGPKGQFVIPIEARKKLGIKAGDRVVIVSSAHKQNMLGVYHETSFHEYLKEVDKKLEMIHTSYEKIKKER